MVKLAQQKNITTNWSSYHNRKTAEKNGQVSTTEKYHTELVKLPQQKKNTAKTMVKLPHHKNSTDLILISVFYHMGARQRSTRPLAAPFYLICGQRYSPKSYISGKEKQIFCPQILISPFYHKETRYRFTGLLITLSYLICGPRYKKVHTFFSSNLAQKYHKISTKIAEFFFDFCILSHGGPIKINKIASRTVLTHLWTEVFPKIVYFWGWGEQVFFFSSTVI